jgi:hypothetical protein
MNKMNLLKQTALLLLMSIFMLTSCDKDEDNVNSKRDNLIGLWTITSSETEITINGTDIIEYFMAELGLSQSDAEAFAEMFQSDMTGTIEFNSDGTYEAVSGGATNNGTWELNGDTLTMDKGTEDEADAEIISISSSKLVLEISETDSSSDMNEDGTNDTLVVRITLNCSK